MKLISYAAVVVSFLVGWIGVAVLVGHWMAEAFPGERNQRSNCLIPLDMKKNNSKPVLSERQLWKTDKGYVQIRQIGKRLVDYKMMRQPGQKAVKTQTIAIDTLEAYLTTQKAVLVP